MEFLPIASKPSEDPMPSRRWEVGPCGACTSGSVSEVPRGGEVVYIPNYPEDEEISDPSLVDT